MAKTLKEAELTTASARSKLEPGEHFRSLDADAALGYRRGARAGIWFARWRNHYEGAAYKQASIGPANDANDKPTEGLLTFHQAEAAARKVVAKARADAAARAAGPAPTVRFALESYMAMRNARDSKRKGREIRSDAAQRMRLLVVGREKRGKLPAVAPRPLAAVELHALTENDLRRWLASLPEYKATGLQRIVNDLKAALRAAYKANRKGLDPKFPDKGLDPKFLDVVQYGLRVEAPDDDASVDVARDNQILTDAQISRLLGAAREIDAEQEWGGDLFRMVVAMDATGARYSQIARMRVMDYQRTEKRLMVPTSRKGTGKNKNSHIPVPVDQAVLDVLLPAVTGRAPEEPLLMHWRSVQKPGSMAWERERRVPWQKSEIKRPWAAVVDRAGMSHVIPYALRHSSIVRGIRANLPIRLVAAKHDTSVLMIERHYSRYIVEGLEDLMRATLTSRIPTENDGKVTRIRERA